MDHYLDLTLLPDPEFPQAQLMNALFAKLHRGLHDLRRDDVGVSFPGVSRDLGGCLRLHGSAEALDRLMALKWLTGMRDHLRVGELTRVPADTEYRCVSRVQVDSNPDRARRRLMKRHNLNYEEACQRIPDGAARRSDLPFVVLRSNGSGDAFRLFIRHGPLLRSPKPGRFGGYGLSAETTIPWF